MSSWRETAKRVLARDDGADPCQPNSDATEWSAAPIAWAAEFEALAAGPRPDGICERDWRAFLNLARGRVAALGAVFAANGWTFGEVFGVGEHWARLDQRGCGWLALGGDIVEVTPARVVFARGKDRTTHHKRRPH